MWPACLLLCISNGKDGHLVSCCEVLEVQETFTSTTCSSGQHETCTAMDQTKDLKRRKGAPVHAILR
jgi:hypothetical protein